MKAVAGGAERSHQSGGGGGRGLKQAEAWQATGRQGFLAAGNAMGCAPW